MWFSTENIEVMWAKLADTPGLSNQRQFFETMAGLLLPPIDTFAAEAVRGTVEKVQAAIDKGWKMRNVLGFDICDLCGERWPAHREDCEVGWIMTALRARALADPDGEGTK